MKIKSIKINGVGGISSLNIDFDDQINFICGPNGIGKTTILECIAHTFSSDRTNILKRNVSCSNGHFDATVLEDGKMQETNIAINDFSPDKQSQIRTGLYELSKKLLSLKVSRTFSYQSLEAVGKDHDKPRHIITEEAKSGVNIKEVKNWFVNRYLYSAHNVLSHAQLNNLDLAKKSISLLSPGFSFSRVDASSNEIMINSPSGEIYYEYLSSGFKSCLSIIFGIIKDIEFRFKEEGITAKEFDGIILIDELELHLHPDWQSKIADILVQIFPKSQFITTTHSPHIIQHAKSNQIIALSSENGQVFRRKLEDGEFGYQGWTVEEILVDVMGMEDTRTSKYKNTISSFAKAVEQENKEEAQKYYYELDQLLHPDNYLRKLLKLELATL